MSTSASLPPAFYGRDPDDVARDLLGRHVHRDLGDTRLTARIVETEAYRGPNDPGSHARNGPTGRSQIMWGPPGRAYAYLVYGSHDMLNAVAHPPGGVGAVLVRAVEPLDGRATMARLRDREADDIGLTNGPGKLCQALAITVDEHNGHALDEPPLWIAQGEPVPDGAITTGVRVGLTDDDARHARYAITDNPYVSHPRLETAGSPA